MVPVTINVAPTATFRDPLNFIQAYNQGIVSEMPKSDLDACKMYLDAAITRGKYEYTVTNVFLLKLAKLIRYAGMIIGAVVNVVNDKTVISTELMFIKPVKRVDLDQVQKELKNAQTRVNARNLLSFPLEQSVSEVHWVVNPIAPIMPLKCNHTTLREQFDKGKYNSEIYRIMMRDLSEKWKLERDTPLETFVINATKKMGSPVYTQTKIDKLIVDIEQAFPQYDSTVVQMTIGEIFDRINAVDKTATEAVDYVKSNKQFDGFAIKNVHKLNRQTIRKMVVHGVKQISTKTKAYPKFDIVTSVEGQRDMFYKNDKLMIHSHIYGDLINMAEADLTNPFRLEYILNVQLTESSYLRPHLGELIYIQPIEAKQHKT